MDERPDSSQQLMDILLVMDEKGTLQAVSGVKDGELQTKNPLEDNNDLLRVDRHGDMFSNFFSNLWNQLKDPTRFHFFRVPEEEVQRVAADFRQRESQSVKTGEPLVAQYEVQPPVQAQQQTQAGQQQQPRVRRQRVQQLGQRRTCLGPAALEYGILVRRVGHRRQNSDHRHHDHEFNQGEPALFLHVCHGHLFFKSW